MATNAVRVPSGSPYVTDARCDTSSVVGKLPVASERDKLVVDIGAADTNVAMKMQTFTMACMIVAKGYFQRL
jgi:hypothetical protein